MNKEFRIFVVEDDPWYGQLLKHHLSLNPDYKVFFFSSGTECLNSFHLNPDVVCMDYTLPDIDGTKLLQKIQEIDYTIPIIVISGQEDIGVAVKLLKSGARDYIIKDEHTKDLLWKTLINLRENATLKEKVIQLEDELEKKYSFQNTIVGQSDAIKRVFRLIEKAVDSNINISITGETGTGKEVVAKAIHFNSNRRKGPFIAVNMAAIPKDLIESELFGHEKGAFTGATGQKKGKFEEAHGGTIFLDEIGEMDINMQTKLLRALQEREIVRVGGNTKVKFDARLITATHKNLADEVSKGNFREDLYFRIIGFPIEIPPLRDRGKDILILAKHFATQFMKENKKQPLQLSNKATQKLLSYKYPGNVRELRAVVELACVIADGPMIEEQDLTFHQIATDDMFIAEEKTLKQFTVDIITHFLKKYNQNVVQVAEKLDIGKSTIYNMIKAGDIQIK